MNSREELSVRTAGLPGLAIVETPLDLPVSLSSLLSSPTSTR